MCVLHPLSVWIQRHGTLSIQELCFECGTYHPIDIFHTGTKTWDLKQEGGGHGLQGLRRPFIKPVDGTAVHKRGELSQACTEDFSNRAEGKTHAEMRCYN